MRSLFVISVILCLGLATAAPTKVEDLLKALLKRQADESAPAVPEKPADHGEIDLSFIPTDIEWGAMQSIGAAIVHMTKLAKEDPMSVIKFVMAVDEAFPAETKRALLKRQMGGGPRGPHGSNGPHSSHGPPVDPFQAQFTQEMFANGLYDTVIKYTNIFGRILENSGAIFQWTIMGPECTTCPPLPEDLVPILLEMAGNQGPPPHGGPSGVQGGPSGAQRGPSGAQRGPSGAQRGPVNQEGSESDEDDSTEKDSEEERALLKRILAIMANKK